MTFNVADPIATIHLETDNKQNTMLGVKGVNTTPQSV